MRDNNLLNSSLGDALATLATGLLTVVAIGLAGYYAPSLLAIALH